MPVTAGLGRLQLRLFAPLLGPPRPGGGLSLRRWHPGGRRGATTGETTGKLRGNHVENVGKPREKCGLMRCFYIFFFSWEISGKVYGKSMEHGDFTSKHWHLTKKKCSSTCKRQLDKTPRNYGCK